MAMSKPTAMDVTAQMSPVDFRKRLRWLLVGFIALLLTVYGRLIALEVRDGQEYRAMSAEPTVRNQTLPAMRGRILARDSTVLAYDQPLFDLVVNYRWLQEPADPVWLKRTAKARLSPAQRHNSHRVAEEQQQILAERHELWSRLALLCGLSVEQWQARTQRIQTSVEKMADRANARRQDQRAASQKAAAADDANSDSASGWISTVIRSVGEALMAGDDTSPAPVVVAEELAEQTVYEGLPWEAVAEIETHPQQYPGASVIRSYRRTYPQGNLAAHVLGYLGLAGPADLAKSKADSSSDAAMASLQPGDWLGRAGIERQYEHLLRGRPGVRQDQFDARGQKIASAILREPVDGADVVLTIDPALERTAELLLDEAVARRLPSGDEKLDSAAGGALVAMDVHSGAILAAASSPRFDPGDFITGNSANVNKWLSDPATPLLNRCVQMALPPGSVFKIVSAAALLSAGVDPDAPFECQGYLHQPDALRCAIFRRTGAGHGPVSMVEALARSCNVYFFHYAEQIGVRPLEDWATKFGLGRRSEVDLPGEVGGWPSLKNDLENKHDSSGAPKIASQPNALLVSIGQGPVTATAMQVVRMAAAVANGGLLVTPHVAEGISRRGDGQPAVNNRADSSGRPVVDPFPAASPQPIAGLNEQMLAIIRKGLRQTVADELGTAHEVINLANVAVAGKTGTAETGANQPEHAWFVGYAPAEQPQVAFVAVIEHAGDAAPATGPVVQYLVQRMDELGYFNTSIDRTAGDSGQSGRAR
jgi:penicillin-binding protein 2